MICSSRWPLYVASELTEWTGVLTDSIQAADIPLVILAPLCMRSSSSLDSRVLTAAAAVHAGLGRDTWTVPFQDITHMLYVRY